MSSVCRGFNCPPQDAGESRNASSGSADNHLPHDYDEPTFGKHDFNHPPPHLEEHRGEPRYAINPDYPGPRDGINDKIMVSTVIVLLFVLFFAVLLNVYATWFWRQSARFSGRNRRISAFIRSRLEFTGEEPLSLLNVGLDSAVLETLPIFLYKTHYFTDGLECAVCLCEFEENETGRLLPNCGHSFYLECIDMWFLSHSTCPVCRKGAQLEQEVLEPARAEQVSVAMAGPITSDFHDNLNLEQEDTATCREEYNLQNPTNIFSRGRQKQMKTATDEGSSGGRASIPQIVIDIPKTPDGFLSSRESHQLHSPNGSLSSSRSPIAGLRSLTRMLSSDTQKMVFPRSSC